MTVRYQAIRTDNVALREQMKAFAHERHWCQLARLSRPHVLQRRERYQVKNKLLFRIYHEKKLAVPY